MVETSQRGGQYWSPSGDPTRLSSFRASTGHASWADLLDWSLSDLNGFWAAVAAEFDVRWAKPPSGGIALGSASMPGADWFPGARLNYAEHALRHHAAKPDGLAVVAKSQSRDDVTLTWAELHDQVSRAAAGLRRLGVGSGDCVAAYAPNCAETLVLYLATAAIGAVWSSCSPEFGVRSVLDRLSQVRPTALLVCDGYMYGDRRIERSSEVEEIVGALPSLRHVIGLRHLGSGEDGYRELLAGSLPEPIRFESVPFDHPLCVLFSSGTTGLPKAIVHGHGGLTLEHLKLLGLHLDLDPDDRFFWHTTTGWTMWNILVSGLLVGSSLVLFDGDPTHPDLMTLWNLAAETSVTAFGVSASFLMGSKKAGLEPHQCVDLSRLRMVGSTGSPLAAEGFQWVRQAVGERVLLNSISGGTDVCTAFVGMVPDLPVRDGEMTTRYLGCAVEAYSSDGEPMPPGQTGELVVTQPMPSMPVALLGDDADQSRLRAAYFDHFPGIWRHGDWIVFEDDGACRITGRSDATLNRGGVRLGTSDFYTTLEAMTEITDSLVIHLEAPTDRFPNGELILFVALEAELDDDLRARIANTLRAQLSPRHVPDTILAVPSVPRTLTGKKLEVPVKQILGGAPADTVASRGALAEPDSLSYFEKLATQRDTVGATA